MCSASVSAVLTSDIYETANMGDAAKNFGLFNLDTGLEPYKDHFRYRMKRYVDQKRLIEKHEGSLDDFSLGKYGIRVSYFGLCVGIFVCNSSKLLNEFFVSNIFTQSYFVIHTNKILRNQKISYTGSFS